MGANPEGDAGDSPPTIFEWGTVSGDSPLTSRLRPLCLSPHAFRFISLKCSDSSVFQSINILCPPPVFCTSPQKWGGQEKSVGDIEKNFLLASLAKLFIPP